MGPAEKAIVGRVMTRLGASMNPLCARSPTILACAFVCATVCACAGTPAAPDDTLLPTGGWAGDGACLSITDRTCDLVAGCGHGRFARPTLRADGTFVVDGSYRIEAGPIGIDPAPPAKFSGVLNGDGLTLTVVPSAPSLPPVTYRLRPANASGMCVVLCL
jgi:hypothetical protein